MNDSYMRKGIHVLIEREDPTIDKISCVTLALNVGQPHTSLCNKGKNRCEKEKLEEIISLF